MMTSVSSLTSKLHPSLLRTSLIKSSEASIPIKLLIQSGRNGIVFISFLVGYTSIIPFDTLPQPRSSTSSHALSSALKAFSGSSPFSYLEDASVLRPFLIAVLRTLTPLKVADSNRMVFVVSRTSEFSPPITPAMAQTFSSSAITSISPSSMCSFPSRVTVFSPSLAVLTII